MIDRSQTGQTLFLKSLAKGAANHRGIRGIFIHTDNERTDDMIQDGVMRGDARKRVIKETNHRLVDLFAEAGVGTVGLHWHQVGSLNDMGTITFHNDPRTRIPRSTHLMLSNLSADDGTIEELQRLAEALSMAMSLPLLHVTTARLDGVFVQKNPEGDDRNAGASSDMFGKAQKIGIDAWNALNDFIRGN